MIRTFMDSPANGMIYKSIVEAFTGCSFEQLIDSLVRSCLFPVRLTPAQAQVVLNTMLSKDRS